MVENTHLDAGTSKVEYDQRGNVLATSNQKQIFDGTQVKYTYDGFNRPLTITFPFSDPISNVKYEYHNDPSSGNNFGKLMSQVDGSGGIKYEYDVQGEITKTCRTIYNPTGKSRHFVHNYTYDSWHRMLSLTYPDGELVNYKYDKGGNLESMYSNEAQYIKNIGYNEFNQRVIVEYGNGTINNYAYTPILNRLQNASALENGGTQMLDNQYKYDLIGNITEITNNASITSNNMGGQYSHAYKYDNYNRLVKGDGKWGGTDIGGGNDFYSDYHSEFSYGILHRIESKNQMHSKNNAVFADNTYDHTYKYDYSGTYNGSSFNVANGLSKISGTNEETFDSDPNGNVTKQLSPICP
ncbi:MAG: RHS repeat protein [Saprospiraceae bacterium]|nr:RHS repeat protein [Saprospiraceae bacterium]